MVPLSLQSFVFSIKLADVWSQPHIYVPSLPLLFLYENYQSPLKLSFKNVKSVWLSCGTNWPCLTAYMYMLSSWLPRGVSPIYSSEVCPFHSNTVFSGHKQFTYSSLRQNITRTFKFPYAGKQTESRSASKPEPFTTQTRRRRRVGGELQKFSTSSFCFWTTATVGNRSTPDGFYLCNLAELPDVDEGFSLSTENLVRSPPLWIAVKYCLEEEDALFIFFC